MSKKLATQPYKGTRDFFPAQMRLRKKVFRRLEEIVEVFGYEPYDGPLLESFDLYAAKTGEEIVNEQLYSFEDRGGRKVAIRPEMTPTLARMVAQKQRELAKPIRWYSIPNLWRYESPQRGRLREHWQLNVDVFGLNGIEADVEIFILAIEILRGFGASAEMFRLYYNHRAITDLLLEEVLQLNSEMRHATAKAIDKMKKISSQEFAVLLEQAGLSAEQIKTLQVFFQTPFDQIPQQFPALTEPWTYVNQVVSELELAGYGQYLQFSPEIMRGFDYYTGMVFEVFDLNEENRRSLFGGGRYDNLVGLFGTDSLSGIGFGMGDVTFFDFLETHQLMPEAARERIVMLALFPGTSLHQVWQVARQIQNQGIGVDIPWGIVKLGKQFQSAEKKGIEQVLLLDEQALQKDMVQWKDLGTGQQKEIAIKDISSIFQKA